MFIDHLLIAEFSQCKQGHDKVAALIHWNLEIVLLHHLSYSKQMHAVLLHKHIICMSRQDDVARLIHHEIAMLGGFSADDKWWFHWLPHVLEKSSLKLL